MEQNMIRKPGIKCKPLFIAIACVLFVLVIISFTSGFVSASQSGEGSWEMEFSLEDFISEMEEPDFYVIYYRFLRYIPVILLGVYLILVCVNHKLRKVFPVTIGIFLLNAIFSVWAGYILGTKHYNNVDYPIMGEFWANADVIVLLCTAVILSIVFSSKKRMFILAPLLTLTFYPLSEFCVALFSQYGAFKFWIENELYFFVFSDTCSRLISILSPVIMILFVFIDKKSCDSLAYEPVYYQPAPTAYVPYEAAAPVMAQTEAVPACEAPVMSAGAEIVEQPTYDTAPVVE